MNNESVKSPKLKHLRRMILFSLFLFFLYTSAADVLTLEKGTQVNPVESNATYYMGQDLNFSSVIVYNETVNFSSTNVTTTSVNPVNVTIRDHNFSRESGQVIDYHYNYSANTTFREMNEIEVYDIYFNDSKQDRITGQSYLNISVPGNTNLSLSKVDNFNLTKEEVLNYGTEEPRTFSAGRKITTPLSLATGLPNSIDSQRGVLEGLTVSGDRSTVGDALRQITDSFGLQSVTDRVYSGDRLVGTGVGFTPTVQASVSFYRYFSTGLSVSSDTGTVGDAFRGVVDSFGVQEVRERTYTGERLFGTTIGITPSTQTSISFLRYFAEDISIQENQFTERGFLRTIGQNLGFNDQINRSGDIYRVLVESVSVQSSSSSTSAIERVTEEAVSVGIGVSQTGSVFRELGTTLSLTTDRENVLGLERSISEGVGVSDSRAIGIGLGRVYSDIYGFGSTEDTSSEVLRSLEETLEVQNSPERTISASRVLESVVGISEQTSQNKLIEKTVEEGLSMGIGVSTGTDFTRSLVSGFGVNTVEERRVTLSRVINTNFGFDSLFEQILGGSGDGSEEDSDSDESDTGGGGSGSSGGGGLGGIVDSVVEDGSQEENRSETEKSTEITLGTGELVYKLRPGDSATQTVDVSNTGTEEADLNLTIEKISQIVSSSEESLNLPVNETQTLEFEAEAPELSEEEVIENLVKTGDIYQGDVYNGKVRVDTEGSSGEIDVKVIVESSEPEQLEVLLESGEDELPRSLELYSTGKKDEVRTNLSAVVYNSTGQKVHSIEGNTSVDRLKSLPMDLEAVLSKGEYMMEVEAQFDDENVTENVSFTIQEREDKQKIGESLKAILLIATLIALFSVAIVLYKRKRLRSKTQLSHQKAIEEIKSTEEKIRVIEERLDKKLD